KPSVNAAEWDSECPNRFQLPQDMLGVPRGPELVRRTDGKPLLSKRPRWALQSLPSPLPAAHDSDARESAALYSIPLSDAVLRRANPLGLNPDGHCSLPCRDNISWLGRGRGSFSSAAPWTRRL